MIKNKIFALIFRAAALIFSIVGVLAMLQVFNGKFEATTLMYYTLISNILIIGLFSYLLITTILSLKKEGLAGNASFAPRFEMICVIDIFLTFVVYWALLVPQKFAMNSEMNLWSFSNLAVHAITPLFCFIDYFLFTSANHLKYRDLYYSLIFPVAYWAVMSVVGACGFVFSYDKLGAPVHYPYFFFDYDRTGWFIIVYVLVIIGFLLLLSHLLYWIDRKWSKKPIVFKKKIKQ